MLSWGELASFGMGFWSREAIEPALGADLADAIPELLRLADLEVRILASRSSAENVLYAFIDETWGPVINYSHAGSNAWRPDLRLFAHVTKSRRFSGLQGRNRRSLSLARVIRCGESGLRCGAPPQSTIRLAEPTSGLAESTSGLLESTHGLYACVSSLFLVG